VSSGIIARTATSVVGRGWPIAIALPSRLAIAAAMRSCPSVYATSARLSRKTSRPAVATPRPSATRSATLEDRHEIVHDANVGGGLTALVIIDAAREIDVAEVVFDHRVDRGVIHLGRYLAWSRV
jgi:hypothetical protein